MVSDKLTIANHFNRFFSTFESPKDVTDQDCIKYIYESFIIMNSKKTVKPATNQNKSTDFNNDSLFKFTTVTEVEVLKLINKLFIEQFKDKYIFDFNYYFYKKNTFVKKKKF